MVALVLSIEEIEVVVDGVVVCSHTCPAEEEVEQGCRPQRSHDLFIDEVDPVSLQVVLVETAIAEVEVQLLVVRIP